MARVPEISVAHAVRSIAEALIPEHHPHLRGANVLYLFTDQPRKRCDRVRLGSAAKLNSMQRFLASGLDGVDQGPDFLILIDQNEWATLDDKARVALVDHELYHCALFVKEIGEGNVPQWMRWTPELGPPDGDYIDRRWGMRGHDIEEFGEVLFRRGFWKPHGPERKFGEIVAMQLKMTA